MSPAKLQDQWPELELESRVVMKIMLWTWTPTSLSGTTFPKLNLGVMRMDERCDGAICDVPPSSVPLRLLFKIHQPRSHPHV